MMAVRQSSHSRMRQTSIRAIKLINGWCIGARSPVRYVEFLVLYALNQEIPLNSSTLKHIELPIEGMTCAACATRIEKNLNKLSGVQAVVNFANEKAHVNYDESQVRTDTLINTIEKSGFHIAPQSVQLQLHKMTCAACAGHIEKALNQLPGVTAHVNVATETAKVSFHTRPDQCWQLDRSGRECGL